MKSFIKRWWPEVMLLSAVALLLTVLCGCGPDVEKARQAVAAAKKEVTDLQVQVQSLTELAERTGNENIRTAAIAADQALRLAAAKIPEMEAALKNLEGATPAWKVALGFALPYVPRIALLVPGLAAIPGVGGILEALARLVANAAWMTTATKKQKAEDV
jgi:hypothetical protein